MDEVRQLVRGLLSDLLVRGLVEQVRRQLAVKVELEYPALAVRVGVDELRLGRELLVDGGDASRHGRVQVARGLHRLDHAEAFSRRELAARAGQLQKDDVAKLRLREVGD